MLGELDSPAWEEGRAPYREATEVSVDVQVPPLRRNSPSGRGAQYAGGLMGSLFYAASGSFRCPRCGKIAGSEFPPDVRRRMLSGTLLLLIPAVALLLVAFALVIGR
jgi:hypothetical protein